MAAPVTGLRDATLLRGEPEKADLSRQCGTCTLCCHLPDIDELEKPANELCRHCIEQQGCRIYGERPQLCRDFLCLWRTDPRMGDHWAPASSSMMVYRQGPQITVLVDPSRPDVWHEPVYLADLEAWAAAAEQDGGYVIVFAGDSVTRVLGKDGKDGKL